MNRMQSAGRMPGFPAVVSCQCPGLTGWPRRVDGIVVANDNLASFSEWQAIKDSLTKSPDAEIKARAEVHLGVARALSQGVR